MSTDRELLKWAAKAVNGGAWHPLTHEKPWNPLIDDCDAFRLSVKLGIAIEHNAWIEQYLAGKPYNDYVKGVIATGRAECEEPYGDDPCAATRRAIVRAAAVIGKAMP